MEKDIILGVIGKPGDRGSRLCPLLVLWKSGFLMFLRMEKTIILGVIGDPGDRGSRLCPLLVGLLWKSDLNFF